MHIIIKVKDTDNVIGLKEDIAMRLEGIADIEGIDVREEEYTYANTRSSHIIRQR